MERQHITREEAAEIFGVTYKTFGKRMERGMAPRPLPGTRRWSKDAVTHAAKFGMQAHAESPPPAPSDPWAEWMKANDQ